LVMNKYKKKYNSNLLVDPSISGSNCSRGTSRPPRMY
jgi:hypothetical protein